MNTANMLTVTMPADVLDAAVHLADAVIKNKGADVLVPDATIIANWQNRLWLAHSEQTRAAT